METKEKSNLTIVSKRDEIIALNEKRQGMVDFLEKRIGIKEAELENKKYVVEGKADVASTLHKFLLEEAQWKFSEALGVIESVKQVEEASKALMTKKTTELMLPTLAIEAIYYFLTKVEGVGTIAANEYVAVLKPVSDALSRAKQERTDLEQLQRDKGTLESAIDSGVDIENEDTILKEIQAEMDFEMKAAADQAKAGK
jgi:hypothetical protein